MNTIGTMQVSMDDMLQTATATVAEPTTDVEEDDFFTPEMVARYDQMVDDYYAGKLKPAAVLHSHEDIDNYFESLCSTK